MGTVATLCKVCLLLMMSVYPVWAANILAIFYAPSYSHQMPLLRLSKALAAKGHNLTVITTNPSKVPIVNHTEIDISFAYEMMKNGSTGISLQSRIPMRKLLQKVLTGSGDMIEKQMRSPAVKDFLSWAKDIKFDLVLYESLWATPYLALAHTLGAPPVIGILTVETMYMFDSTMGCPIHTGYVPAASSFTDHMTFFERIVNTYNVMLFLYYRNWYTYPNQDQLIKKLFGEGLPSSYELDHNKTLLIYSSDGILGYQKPLTSNIVQVGPLHILPPKALPEDLKSWVDDAKDGVIYFSLGSNMQGTSLPEDTRDNFMDAFKQMPNYHVIWKWESDTYFPGEADNVLFKKWIPQQDLLANDKVKVFISQCGLQSTQEAIHYTVNVICIPVFGDQEQNAQKVVDLGIGIELDFDHLTQKMIHRALSEIVNNPKYRENIQLVSLRVKDRILPPVEHAVWWVEYIVRHKGARHLRPPTLDLNWIQYFFIDIALFFIFITSLSLFIVFKLIKTIFRWWLSKQSKYKAKSQ